MSTFKVGEMVEIDFGSVSSVLSYYTKGQAYKIKATDIDDAGNISVYTEDDEDFWVFSKEQLISLQQQKPHVHHDMIVAWAANPSRVVEYFDVYQNIWFTIGTPNWGCDIRYRFADEVVQKPKFPTTSLSLAQLEKEYYDADGTDFDIALFAVANAAIKQYILDCENK